MKPGFFTCLPGVVQCAQQVKDLDSLSLSERGAQARLLAFNRNLQDTHGGLLVAHKGCVTVINKRFMATQNSLSCWVLPWA